MSFLVKKEYRLGLILTIAFGLFLYTVDLTSAQLVSFLTDIEFHYVKPAFLKLIYLVLFVVTLAFLSTLNKSENSSSTKKGKAFNSFVLISVLSFLPGWLIHLYFVVKTVKVGGSFITLEEQWWFYNASDFTIVIGFILASLLILHPTIHKAS